MSYDNPLELEQAMKKLSKEKSAIIATPSDDMIASVLQQQRIKEIDEQMLEVARAAEGVRERREQAIKERARTLAANRDKDLDELLELMVEFTEEVSAIRELGEKFNHMRSLSLRVAGADDYLGKYREAGVRPLGAYPVSERKLNNLLRLFIIQTFGVAPFNGVTFEDKIGIDSFDLTTETERAIKQMIEKRKVADD